MNMLYLQDRLNESKRNNVLNWILDTPMHSWEKHGFQCFSVVSPRILLALTIGLVYGLIKKAVHLCLLYVNKTPPCGLHPILPRLVPSDKVFYTVQFGYLKRWSFVFSLKYKKILAFFSETDNLFSLCLLHLSWFSYLSEDNGEVSDTNS